jgi:methyl-accepting chemotaxis protein
VNDVPIVGKIVSILSVFGMFCIGVAFYAASEMHAIGSDYSNVMHGSLGAAYNITRANRAFEDARASMAEFLLSPAASNSQGNLKSISYDEAQFRGRMESAAENDPLQAEEIGDLSTRGQQLFGGDCSNAVKLGGAAVTVADLASIQTVFLKTCAAKFDSVERDMLAEAHRLDGESSESVASLKAEEEGAISITFALILGGLVLVMLGGFWATRSWISVPVKALQGVMGRLTGGDLQAEVTGTERKDEIGGMARAVQVFKEAGIEKQRVEAEAAAQRAAAEQERQRVEAERAAAAK